MMACFGNLNCYRSDSTGGGRPSNRDQQPEGAPCTELDTFSQPSVQKQRMDPQPVLEPTPTVQVVEAVVHGIPTEKTIVNGQNPAPIRELIYENVNQVKKRSPEAAEGLCSAPTGHIAAQSLGIIKSFF